MKIIIQQYLSTLKESKELDAILPDLLLSMNFQPITKPQIGVRQHGVDLAAIGKDPEKNIQKLFLFVIKCGDIGRNEWDSNKQSVRQTLNEIQDSYIPHFIPTKYKDLPRRHPANATNAGTGHRYCMRSTKTYAYPPPTFSALMAK